MKSKARKFFDENGYYLARGVYSAQEIGRLEEEFDRIVRQIRQSAVPYSGPNAAEDNGIISTTNVQKYSALWLTQGLLHKGFLDTAEQFIGTDIVLQRSSLYEKKKSNVVGPFRMHQDWIYGPTQQDTVVSGMIHVARTTAPMGALRVYPGTQPHADGEFQGRRLLRRLPRALPPRAGDGDRGGGGRCPLLPLLSGARFDVQRDR